MSALTQLRQQAGRTGCSPVGGVTRSHLHPGPDAAAAVGINILITCNYFLSSQIAD